VSPGAQVTCEVRVVASSTPLELEVASSSEQARTPAVVAARPDQSSLTFQVSIDPLARPQSVRITTSWENEQMQDAVLVLPGAGPVLSIPKTQFARLGTVVRFVVGAEDPSDLPVQLTAQSLPTGASFDPATGLFHWIPVESQQGTHVLVFTATNSAGQSSAAQVTIEVDAGAPSLTPSQAVGCSPNAIGSLAGRWLAPENSVLSDPSGSTVDLGGVRVQVNGQAVPVLYRSATRVNFLCPALAAGAPLSIAVETPEGITAPLSSTMNEVSPVIRPLLGSAEDHGLLAFVGTQDRVMERDFSLSGHPAQPGDEVLIFASGLGKVDTFATLLVEVGGAYARTDSVQPVAGHAGLYAIQVRVPTAPMFGDAVPVQVEVFSFGGQQVVSNVVTAAIEAAR